MWLVWSQHSKIDCISKMDWWNKLIFLHPDKNSGKLKLDSLIFEVGVVKNDHSLLVHETLKSAYLKNEFINWAGFLNADSDAIIFGFYSLNFKYGGTTGVVLLVYVFDWLYFICCLTSFSFIDHCFRLCAWFVKLYYLT